MLLTIDIGNTSITAGVFQEDILRANWQMATEVHRLSDEYAALLLHLFSFRDLKVTNVTGIAICCVVPPLLSVFKELCQNYFHLSPLIVEAGIKTGVKIRMDNPKEVGTDRIVNAAAAHHLYKGPIIITDLGTATTFDTVSSEGVYLGGAIAPGINTAAEALFIRAAKLPRVDLSPPKHVIGTNTIAAMQSGILYGYVSLIEGMVARIEAELGEKSTVVATGGYSNLIARQTEVINVVNPELTLVGLRIIYRMNQVRLTEA